MENNLQSIFEDFVMNAVEPVFFCNPEGKIIIWNKGCEYLFGYSFEEIQRYSIISLIERKSIDRFESIFDSVKKGRMLTFEITCATKDRKTFEAEITLGTLKNQPESVIYLIVKDNTHVKKLNEKVMNLSLVPECIPDFIMEWDKTYGINYYNSAVRNFFKEIGEEKVEPDKILPRGYERAMHKIVGSDKYVADVQTTFGDRTFSYNFTPFRMDEEKVLIIGKDISFKKNLETEIDDAYNKTRNILDFIEGILKEFRYMDMEEEINLKPIASLFLRDQKDSKIGYPSHVFIGQENSERNYEGYIMTKADKDLKCVSENISLSLSDLSGIISSRGESNFANWGDKHGDIEAFQNEFPSVLRDSLPQISNYVSYKISGTKNGIFIAFNYPREVSKYDAETIKGLAVAVGTLYSMQTRFREKEETQISVFNKMAELAEKRDRESGEHLKRIRSYSVVIAEWLSHLPKFEGIIDQDFLRKLYEAATFHDIGKIGIPDSILQKPGKLDDKEYEAMREHTIVGGKILEGPKFLEMARDIAFYHHEKYDGSGYPYGMKGEEIPLPARIVTIADVYDAMTSKRVYKDAMSHDRTKKLIAICSGTHFDPDVVDAFLATEQEFIKIKEKYKG